MKVVLDQVAVAVVDVVVLLRENGNSVPRVLAEIVAHRVVVLAGPVVLHSPDLHHRACHPHRQEVPREIPQRRLSVRIRVVPHIAAVARVEPAAVVVRVAVVDSVVEVLVVRGVVAARHGSVVEAKVVVAQRPRPGRCLRSNRPSPFLLLLR